MLNIAVIGCGSVSGYGHLPAIDQSSAWCLKAIVEKDPQRLEEVRARYRPEHAFASPQALWQLPDLDAVVIATHLDSHHDLAVAALGRGVHVLCEKPMAPTLDQCRVMVTAAERAGRLLAVNFNTRSQEIYRVIREVVETGILGRIAVSRFAFLWSNHQWQPPERLAAFMAHGGPIVDSGVHFFDGVRLFTGQEFEQIHAHGAFVTADEHPQHVIASGRLTDGSIAMVEAGWLYTRNTKEKDALYTVELIGEHGAIHADLMDMTLRIHGRDISERRQVTRQDKDFNWIYDRLAQSIQAGQLVGLASGFDGLKATEAAFAALRSAHDLRRVSGGSVGISDV